jgi:hypothetical protein
MVELSSSKAHGKNQKHKPTSEHYVFALGPDR